MGSVDGITEKGRYGANRVFRVHATQAVYECVMFLSQAEFVFFVLNLSRYERDVLGIDLVQLTSCSYLTSRCRRPGNT